MKINIKPLKDLTISERNTISDSLQSSKHSTIFHTIEWNEILSDNFDNEVFIGLCTSKNDSNDIKAIIYFSLKRKYGLFNYYYSPPQYSETLYAGPIFFKRENNSTDISNFFAGLVVPIPTLPS